MAYIMMMWGKYSFGINNAAYQDLQRQSGWRWPSQELFGGAPQPQFTGAEDDTITLNGVIFPEWRGGVGQIDSMRDQAATGDPQILIDGRGNILGLYAATNISETQSEIGGFGIPRKQEFTISLKLVPNPLIGGNIVTALVGKLGIDISAIKNAIQQAKSAIGAIQQAIAAAQLAAQAAQAVIGAPFAAINSASKLAANTAGDFKTLMVNANNLVVAPATTTANAIANANAAVQTVAQGVPLLAVQARAASDSLNTSLQTVITNGVAPAGVSATQAVLVGANRQSNLLSNTFHSFSRTVVTQ